MALTLSLTYDTTMGGSKIAYGTITFDNVYVTGGETLDLSAQFSGSPTVLTSSDDGYVIRHNRGNAAAGVLQAYFANGGAAAGAALIEVTNAADLSAVIVHCIAMGTPALS
jgi:hypothetical protein